MTSGSASGPRELAVGVPWGSREQQAWEAPDHAGPAGPVRALGAGVTPGQVVTRGEGRSSAEAPERKGQHRHLVASRASGALDRLFQTQWFQAPYF